ncbi:MAG: response regulator, partial [Actinomycetota bacterium]
SHLLEALLEVRPGPCEGVKKIKILLVEDDPSVRQLLRVILEVEGYGIVEAKDGHEGLEKAGETRPDLMILDLMMPEVDGENVIAKLRSEPALAALPVIVVSGRDEALSRCRELVGSENVFLKPFEPSMLLRRVGAILGSGSGG